MKYDIPSIYVLTENDITPLDVSGTFDDKNFVGDPNEGVVAP